MGSVTPTVIPGDGYARVEVNWTDFSHARRAWIWRTVAGVDTRLRDGDYCWLSGGLAVAFDHEAPLDTPITYKSGIPLNWNGDFEAGVGEWVDGTNNGTVGTVTQTRAYWAAGNAALLLTPDGVTATNKAVSEFIPATVGVSYTATAQMMVTSYWTAGIGIQIQWYNGTTLLSTSGTLADTTPFPGTWGSYTVTGTAPATTTQMRIVAAIQGTPPATQLLYVDEFYATTAAATVTSAPVLIPSNGAGWWTDPLHPATKVRLQIDLDARTACQDAPDIVYINVGPDKTLAADSAAFTVNDGYYPVGAFGRRKAPRSTIRIGTSTLADLYAVRALHASGAPLLLAMKADFGEPLQYQLCGDLSEGRLHGDQTVQWRLVSADFAEVGPPVGPAEGTLKTRYVDLAKYSTFAAATAAGVTWLDALRGNLA